MSVPGKLEPTHQAMAEKAASSPQPSSKDGSPSSDQDPHAAPTRLDLTRQDFASLNREVEGALNAHRQVGQLQDGAGLPLKVMRRSLTWYTAPLHQHQGASIRALQRLSFISEAHENDLAAVIRAVEQLRDENARLAGTIEEVRQQDARLADEISALKRRSRGVNLLRENDKIIDYWDNAALTDPMRETVTQGADESDEEYQQNWVKVGEYVAGKIMSHSSPNPVALEVGPGMGRITIPMSKYCQSITAIDISPAMAERARQAMVELKNFQVQVITDEDLSFLPSEHFDLAYAISCFQHAEKKSFYRYLEGMRRALKPGGTLFFGVLNLCSEAGWGHFAAIVKGDYPEYFHTPDEISCYLQHAGYSSHELAHEGETLWAIAKR